MGESDPAYNTEEGNLILPKNLNSTTLSEYITIAPTNKLLQMDSTHIQVMLKGGVGFYNVETGIFDYEKHTKKPLVYWINRLHYNRLNGWSIMGDIFASSLILLALTGAVIVRGKKGLAGRGLIYLLIGLAIPILYVIFS